MTVQQQTAASISPLHHVNPYDNAHQNMVTTTDCNQSQLMTIHNSDQALNDVAIEEAEGIYCHFRKTLFDDIYKKILLHPFHR